MLIGTFNQLILKKKSFNYPSISGIQRPESEEDIAFMSSAGAVLVAKLVSGSLAYDDIWFGGRTRNPWNIEEFSTGSSAGPVASTSAGMVPFAFGTETAGSITFPATRCGVTALHPNFGTIGRSGDKIGPFCRSATDCAIILDIVGGKDLDDPSSKHSSLDDQFLVDITKLTVGYLDDAEMEVSHSSNFTKQKLLVDTNNLFDNWQLVREIKKQV
ncbi:hypothetical protein JHK87_019976 [Glycine soja]|nr:hypothetical protein JHK87_019976 [Glycine soja]